ncbi:MAG TPA: NifU family protein [Nocardioides sp.]|jgi:Fe-S cluster biogenesis protein NfuA/nitrite reductase/ring-hydroxylating ferredoxin subunit|nr:NifU family protein [Nocardioides sp.]
MEQQLSVRESSARIDALLDELDQSAVPAVMDRVQELLAAVMGLYGAGLDRTIETLLDADAPELARRLADDEIVGSLFVLHGLHPDPVLTRVNDALERVRPYLGSHAGGVELLGVDDEGIVRLRLQGSCDGCPSSALTVKNAIEDAILLAAPDVVAVEVEGMVEESPDLLQISPFRPHDDPAVPSADPWHALELDVAPRTTRRVEVAGEPLLVANLDGTLVAYLDRCPACDTAPSSGTLIGDALACAGCGTSYDLRLAGRSVDDLQLTPVPLLPEHAAWKVALPHREPA